MTTNDEIGDATIKVSVTDYDDYDGDFGDTGDGSGDGMLRIHPITWSHCPRCHQRGRRRSVIDPLATP